MSAESWQNAALALELLALDPDGLGGAVIRMRASPARDALLDTFNAPLPLRKLPANTADDMLFGGLDLAATLGTGSVATTAGFFSNPCVALLPMAERCEDGFAAKLCQLHDQGAMRALLALDEGIDAEERLPGSLADRLAFHLEPEGRLEDAPAPPPETRGEQVTEGDALIQLTLLAAQFGISSLRAPLLAVRAARAHAQFRGRDTLTTGDLEVAARLVYPHRATQAPSDLQEPDMQTPDDAPQDTDVDQDAPDTTQGLPETDMLVAAVAAALPPGLLAGLTPVRSARQAGGSGAGQKRTSNRRGRPLPSRPGRLDSTTRIDLIATLRTAAPWQPIRSKSQPDRVGLHIRPDDIRIKRYTEHSDRLLIFCVDASGSTAMSRLGEAKGAIELLLADAYASRDHVALIGFRGAQADLLLPPTRSLVQTKRRLSALPGGGGTPLASGLQNALMLAQQSRSKGLSPTVILVTDGRANIALDGTANRAQAAADAERMARMLRLSGAGALVLDMSRRPQTALRTLAQVLDASYIPLPRADAERLTHAVTSALDA